MPKIKKAYKIFSKGNSSLRTKLLLITGFILLSISLIWNLNQTIQLKFFTPKVPQIVKTEKTTPRPLLLSIAAVNVNLHIEETAIRNNTWGISTKGASHLAISANPGEQGPIILYGHNTNDRLGPIRWLTTGKTIDIKTADGKTYSYTIKKLLEVDPKQTDVFNQKTETLILYTCSGFADLKRFVVIATPKRYKVY